MVHPHHSMRQDGVPISGNPSSTLHYSRREPRPCPHGPFTQHWSRQSPRFKMSTLAPLALQHPHCSTHNYHRCKTDTPVTPPGNSVCAFLRHSRPSARRFNTPPAQRITIVGPGRAFLPSRAPFLLGAPSLQYPPRPAYRGSVHIGNAPYIRSAQWPWQR